MGWLDKNWRVLVVGFLMLVVIGVFAMLFLERKDRHEACVEALKSSDVGDLARHLICTQ